MARYIKGGTVNTVQEINSELEKIEFSQAELLSRSGETPNQMNDVLDMNSNRIINTPTPVFGSDVLRLQDLETIQGTPINIGVTEEYLNNLLDSFVIPEIDIWNPDRILTIAHRGYRGANPQNTILAFSTANKIGCDAYECDVQVTSDGIPVLYHDATLDTLTNGTGAIADNTLAQVQAAEFTLLAGSNLSDKVRIPTFEEFLQYSVRTNKLIFPEIKEFRTQSDIEIMIDLIKAYNWIDKTTICSFSILDMEYARAYNPDIRLGTTNSTTDPIQYEDVIDRTAALGNGSLVWNNLSLRSTPSIINYANSKGLSIAAYTIIDMKYVGDLVELGVNSIMTDVPLGDI